MIFVYCSHWLDLGSTVVVFSWLRKRRYLKRVGLLHGELGIPEDYGPARMLPVQMEAARLVSIGPDIYQREQRLAPGAAAAWREMQSAAAGEEIPLQVVSAFRSVEYQQGLIMKKLEKGQPIGDILRVSAAPGFSEHHTGRALDLTTPGYPVLEEVFEQSEAFAWLTRSAGHFGFRMSFPRDNPHGVAYEPWHWAWRDSS